MLFRSILFCIGTPLAWWLARSQSRKKVFVEAIVGLPLILPPTVLGFYLLLFLGPNGPLAPVLLAFDVSLAFSFWGLVIGSVFYSLPFVVQPLQNAFLNCSDAVLEAASTLGASPWDRFFSVVIPQTKAGFITAGVLGFAHTVGEFGVVLMIGGNIPGKTQVLSIAIYEHVEQLDYLAAHRLSLFLLLLCFVLLVVTAILNRRFKKS